MTQEIEFDNLFLSRDPKFVSTLLDEWIWLIGRDASPFAASVVGDAFILDGRNVVHRLDCGIGELTQLVESTEAFYSALDDYDARNDWLLAELVKYLRRGGLSTRPGECYSYKTLPIFGGKYDLQNMTTVNAAEHFGMTGEIHKQIFKQREGTEIQLKIEP